MKSYFKTKHEKDSARITALFAVILILLIFIVGPKYMDPPMEYGVAVNFGTTDFGSGRIQPKKPIKAEQEAVKPPQKVEESKQIPSEPKEVKEEVLTSEDAEAIAIKKQKAKEAKIKAVAEAKAKKEAERIERERKEQEAKKKFADGLISGVKNADGNENSSDGTSNKPGNQGQLNGDPYAPSYFGEPGAGGGGSGYGLRGRGKPSREIVQQKCNEEGRVVVKITVNRNGNVIDAEPGVRGTLNSASCLFEPAKKTALSYKWPANSKAPAKQVGFVVINFSLSQ